MTNIRTLFILFLASINFTSCTSDIGKTESIASANELVKCNLNDTLFKKLTYGTEKNDYDSFLKTEQNLLFENLGGKLKCDYSPRFYNNKLFSLEVDLCKLNLLENYYRPSGLNGSTSVESYGNMLKDNQAREKQANSNHLTYGRLLKLYVDKYGKPSNYEETGKKGEWIKENNDSEFISEYGEFEIKKEYIWKCDSKEIKINATLQAKLNKNEWKSKSANDLLAENSYREKYYDNFKILYIDHKVEALYNSTTKQKGAEMQNKNDSLNKVTDNKIKENI